MTGDFPNFCNCTMPVRQCCGRTVPEALYQPAFYRVVTRTANSANTSTRRYKRVK